MYFYLILQLWYPWESYKDILVLIPVLWIIKIFSVSHFPFFLPPVYLSPSFFIIEPALPDFADMYSIWFLHQNLRTNEVKWICPCVQSSLSRCTHLNVTSSLWKGKSFEWLLFYLCYQRIVKQRLLHSKKSYTLAPLTNEINI